MAREIKIPTTVIAYGVRDGRTALSAELYYTTLNPNVLTLRVFTDPEEPVPVTMGAADIAIGLFHTIPRHRRHRGAYRYHSFIVTRPFTLRKRRQALKIRIYRKINDIETTATLLLSERIVLGFLSNCSRMLASDPVVMHDLVGAGLDKLQDYLSTY